ncbi:hypothetical protein NLG97_g1060 [Lecanicillium saksenae]|uniref:Uncharacterized protein n=1 Tax=Lecanicillium saksenae TaxID=468837 RepID=A0ACC1R6S0_9HYPO|nr:hypothetical protein NLG97_g1060 [Lecanicillium saksenae]
MTKRPPGLNTDTAHLASPRSLIILLPSLSTFVYSSSLFFFSSTPSFKTFRSFLQNITFSLISRFLENLIQNPVKMKFFAAFTLLVAAGVTAQDKNCEANYIVDRCLKTETAKADACDKTDYNCLCAAYQAVATYVQPPPPNHSPKS